VPIEGKVSDVATIDRLEPAYTVWSPSASGFATEDEDYTGKHRAPHTWRHRVVALTRMFYGGRHRRR
jgi:hypothetical protein